MPKRRTWLILLACTIVAGAALVMINRDNEPYYKDHSLSDWLVALADDGPDRNPEQATEAIRQIGTNAIPYLVKYMRYTPSPLRLKTVATAEALVNRLGPYWSEPGDRDQACAQGAYRALGILGPAASAAIQELTQLAADSSNSTLGSGDWMRGSGAIFALGQIGVEALPALMTVLTNQQSSLRSQAAMSFAWLGTNGRPAVPLLIECLRDKNANLVRCSAFSLGRLRQAPDRVVPALVDVLQHPRPLIRCAVAEALGQFGDEARSAVPALLNTLNDTDRLTRKAASNALFAIDPEVLTKGAERAP